MTQVWQIAAGGSSRQNYDYRSLFLKHDVMLLYPGRYGSYKDEVYQQLIDTRRWTSRKRIRMIRQFATEPREGDIVLLMSGYNIEALGLVADGDYSWEETFDDVFGWDLQHTQRVIWQDNLSEEVQNNGERLFAGGPRQIPMFGVVSEQRILGRIEYLFNGCRRRPLKDMPARPPKPLTLEELGSELFLKGLSNGAVGKVTSAIQRQQRLVNWYEEYGKESNRPEERKVVAHLVVPFLLALGWSEELLAVEWGEWGGRRRVKVDLAAFSGTPTTPGDCCLICEAKFLECSLQKNVLKQAKNYVEQLRLGNCKKILVTDGISFCLYQRLENSEWKEEPVGYLNVKLIRTNHIAPADTNAVDTIMALTPAGIDRELV